ncbi:MAG: hypothetical protein WBZ20_16115 [Nitrososphaeraceae archaeon]
MSYNSIIIIILLLQFAISPPTITNNKTKPKSKALPEYLSSLQLQRNVPSTQLQKQLLLMHSQGSESYTKKLSASSQDQETGKVESSRENN